MPFGGQVGDVPVPVEQIECGIFLTEQVIVDDVVPDQIGATEEVKCRRHVAPVQITIRRECLDGIQLLIVHEIEQFASLFEIDLCCEEGRALHAVLFAAAMKECERGCEGGASDAVTDRMHAGHIESLANVIDRIDLCFDVIVPDHVFHARVS